LVLLGIPENPPEEPDGDDDLNGREKVAFHGLLEFFIPSLDRRHNVGCFGARRHF
jgi:hypothetical protein